MAFLLLFMLYILKVIYVHVRKNVRTLSEVMKLPEVHSVLGILADSSAALHPCNSVGGHGHTLTLYKGKLHYLSQDTDILHSK